MDEKYIFDTSFWIWMKNIAYPMGIFPAVWRYFLKIGNQICYCDAIEQEIDNGDNKDSLKIWFNKNKKQFKKVTESSVPKRLRAYYSKDPIQSPEISAQAMDIVIIATAKKENLIIVTDEKPSDQNLSNPIKDPKIPNICKKEKIECFQVENFWKKTGVVFN